MEPITGHRTAGSNGYMTTPSPRLLRSRSEAPTLAYEFKRSPSPSTITNNSTSSNSKLMKSMDQSSKKFNVLLQSFKKNPVEKKDQELRIPKATRKARSAATSPSAWALSPARNLTANPLKQQQELVGGRSTDGDDYKQGEKLMKKKKESGSTVTGVLQRLFRPMKAPSATETEALHRLRMLQTRYMQWRFVNARAARKMALRDMNAQKQLFGVWNRVCELRISVSEKKTQLQKLQQEQRLNRIVGSQIILLEDWEKIEKSYTQSILASLKLMRTLSIEVPLVAGAKGDVHSIHRALCTALDVVSKLNATVTRSLVQLKQARILSCFLSELSGKAKQEWMGLAGVMGVLDKAMFLLVQENSLRVRLIEAMEREGPCLNGSPISWNSDSRS